MLSTSAFTNDLCQDSATSGFVFTIVLKWCPTRIQPIYNNTYQTKGSQLNYCIKVLHFPTLYIVIKGEIKSFLGHSFGRIKRKLTFAIDFRKKVIRRNARASHEAPRQVCQVQPHRIHVNEKSLQAQLNRNDWSDDRFNRTPSSSIMPGGDIELLRYRSLSDINADYSIRRAHSEACFAECRGVFPMLKLSKTRITVGDSVTVYWDIHENCSSNDWIGLFDLGELKPGKR